MLSLEKFFEISVCVWKSNQGTNRVCGCVHSYVCTCVSSHVTGNQSRKPPMFQTAPLLRVFPFFMFFLYLTLTTAKPLARISVQNKLLHLAIDPSKSCDWFPNTNVFNYPKLKSGEDNLWTGLYGQIPYLSISHQKRYPGLCQFIQNY